MRKVVTCPEENLFEVAGGYVDPENKCHFIGLQSLAICLLIVPFNRTGEHFHLLLHVVGVSSLYPSYLARDPVWNSVPNTVLIWLCGQMVTHRWDKMCEQIMTCSPCANGHLVLMAEKGKIEYGPGELAVKYYLEFIFKGRETVSEGMVTYLKENSYLA